MRFYGSKFNNRANYSEKVVPYRY